MVRRYQEESGARAHRCKTVGIKRRVAMQIASSRAVDECERNYIDTYPYVT